MLKPNDYKTFKEMCKLRQKPLHKVMTRFLKEKYNKVIETKAYTIAEGNIPIALVAHLDTVFKNLPREIYIDQEKQVMWSPQGLGADDRAGVFAIFQIIRSGLRPHIILTTDEEMGALGASMLVTHYPEHPFNDLKYIIELDRRGINDSVFYDCENAEFEEYVNKFGFTTHYGTFSDISVICPDWGVAGVNLSIGYEDEHSQIERLYLNNFCETVEKVKNMLNETEIPFFQYIPAPWIQHWQTSQYKTTCAKCGRESVYYDLIPVINNKTKKVSCYCIDCLSEDRIDWCAKCGEAFESIDNELLCVRCAEKGD